MKEEYNYTLTVPLKDLDAALTLLEEVKENNPKMRVSRKPDRKDAARFYLCFPFVGSRSDEKFYKWFQQQDKTEWELFGPNYGVWGLS